jgi:hypothetical protein
MSRLTSIRRLLVAAVVAAGASGLFASAASAHVGKITISCTRVTFSFTGFPETGGQINESVTVNGTTTHHSFGLTGSSGGNSIPIGGANGDVVSASATWTVGGGGSAHAGPTTLSGCKPPCPSGTKPNFQWHYSYNGSSGSWSGTTTATCPGSVSSGPQAMEGNQTLMPGATIFAGYQFTVPGNNSTFFLTVNHPKVTFPVVCANGATPSAPTFSVTMPTATFEVTNSNWIPGTNGFQGKATVPNDCGGADLLLGQGGSAGGGTFTATLS